MTSLTITYTAAAPAYTITAQSNDANFGTVSLSGSVITGAPEEGYRYATPAYTVTNGEATVSQVGDEFTVTPTSDCTVTINFEAIPTHTAHFSVNGTIDNENDNTVREGAAITFPSDPADINGKTFVGWVAKTITGSTDTEPTFITSATMSTADVTFYAVFATAAGSGENSWIETSLAEITSSDVFVFSTGSYVLNNDGGTANAPAANAITVSDGKITSSVADNLKWNVSGDAERGYTFYPNGSSDTWLYCNTTAGSGSNNNIRVGTGDRKVWTLNNSGYLVTNDTYTARYLSLYGDQDFRGYTGTSNGAFAPKFYKYTVGTTYSAYCTTVSSHPVPVITFMDNGSKEITELDITALDNAEISIDCTHNGESIDGATFTVVSSNDEVASFDSEKGTIEAHKSGTVTLTATFAGNKDYQGTSAELSVIVSKATTTVALEVVVDNTDVYTAKEGGLAEGVVKDAAGNAVAGAAVTYNSSNTAVATIDDEGNITLKAAGETTITASYAGNDVYDASEGTFILTLTTSKPQETEVTLNFNNSLYGTSYTGTDAANNGPFDGTTKGVTVTVTQGSGKNLYINNSETRIYGGTTKGNIKIDAPTGYVMTEIVFTAGTWDISSVSTGSLSSKTWTGSASSMTIYANSRSDFQSAVVTLAETVTVGTAGYTTYVTKHDVSFEGVTAYIAKKVNAETITLDAINEAPQGTPVVIKAAVGTYALEAIDTNPTVAGNLLQASDGSVKGNEEGTIFALGVGKAEPYVDVVGFYLVDNNVVVPAGKAYLEVDGGNTKGFTFDFEGLATGINTVKGSGFKVQDSKIYNLAGQRVDGSRFTVNGSGLKTGIYIVNGKKVLVK